jgi:microcystin degradation protein MlrC
MTLRIAVGAISHETNAFSPISTPLAAFQEGTGIQVGQELLDRSRGKRSWIGGFLTVAEREGWEVVGTVGADAMTSGLVAAGAWNEICSLLVEPIREQGSFDGILLGLHGAMIAENEPDAEGGFVRAVRQVVGPDVPIIVAMDLHGNITPEFCGLVNGVFAHDTNPHVDSYERAVEAAECLAAVLDGTLSRPRVVIRKLPLLPPSINMRTAEGPMRTLFERAFEWESVPNIVNVGVFGGYPTSDFEQAGSSIVVTTTDPELGQRCANELGRLAWEIRDQFIKPLHTIVSGLDEAERLLAEGGPGPVVLADLGDNPGGGGPSDMTDLLWELVKRRLPGSVACVWDPETVRQAIRVGVGNEAEFSIGARTLTEGVAGPLVVRGLVRALSDGWFTAHGPVQADHDVALGPTALIDVVGLKLVVTSLRDAPNDQGYFKVVGIEPAWEPLLVIKSRGHFRADFEPISRAIIEINSPGPSNHDQSTFQYRRVRRPIWPLDPEMTLAEDWA